MSKDFKVSKAVKVQDLFEYSTFLANDKDTEKYVKRIETLVRSSQEYKDYILFLRDNVDMTKCAYFNNVDSKDSRKIHIEIHHEPFTLWEIVKTVIDRWLAEAIPLNDLLIADEVMELHYSNLVGLIPLSKTVHEIAHNNAGFVIPLYLIFGDYRGFIDKYSDYIGENLISKLEKKIDQTKAVKEDSFSILDKQFVYLEVDGMTFPEKIEK